MTAFLFAAAAAASLFFGFWFLNRARHLRNIPRTKIRSAPQGYVELEGRARPLGQIPYHTPLGKHPCVWFEYLYRESASDKGMHAQVVRTSQSFLLEDETGVCRIDPIPMQIETRSRKVNLPNKWGLSTHPGLISLRWIGVGEKIQAYGKFTTLRSDFAGRREEMIKSRLAALKRDREAMLRLDLDGDGKVDGGEWDIAREDVIREVEAEVAELQKQHDESSLGHVLRAPDDDRLPFLLTGYAEMKIVARYRLIAAILLLLFVLLLAAIVDAYFIDWIDYEFERGLQPPALH